MTRCIRARCERCSPAGESARRVTYAAVFAEHTGLDIHQCSDADLQSLAAARCGFQGELSRDGYLNLLFSECVEPRLQAPTLVYAFPASQAALARVVEGDDRVPSAARFEMFVKGMELANGYFELTDADEQLRRFEADQAQREAALRDVAHGAGAVRPCSTGVPVRNGKPRVPHRPPEGVRVSRP